jgi:hypothetical protein
MNSGLLYIRNVGIYVFRVPLFLILGAWCTLFVPAARAAVSMNLSPSVIGSDYVGPITLQLSGLRPGENVYFRQYVDMYGAEVLDPSVDPTVYYDFQMHDGKCTVIGGVTNLNYTGDSDAVSGTVKMVFNFSGTNPRFPVGRTFFTIASDYIPGWDGSTNILMITNAGCAQSISGHVSDGTNSMTGVLVTFERGGRCKGAIFTDANGDYSFRASPGLYQLVAYKDGYVYNIQSIPVIDLKNGMRAVANPTLIKGTRSVSGRLAFASPVFMRVKSTDGLVAGRYNYDWNYSAAVTPGFWHLELLADSGLAEKGQLGTAAGSTGALLMDTTVGDFSAPDFGIPTGTALIYGRITNSIGAPVAGVPFLTFSTDPSNTYSGSGCSDTNGYYCALVELGAWRIQAGGGGPVNYFISPGLTATFTNGQALRADFLAEPIARCGEPALTGSQQFSFSLDAAAGYTYSIECSTNFLDPNSWSLLMSTNLSSDSIIVIDDVATQPSKCYRAVRNQTP